MVVVYEEAVLREYYAPWCSTATLFWLFLTLAAVVVPYYLAYDEDTFWLKRNTLYVQPQVGFTYNLLVLLHGFRSVNGQQQAQTWAWSTVPELQSAYQQYLRAPTVRALSEDNNLDGKPDLWQLTVEVPMALEESVHEVQMLAFFTYKLSGKVALEMDGMVYTSHASALPGGSVSVMGEARLHQVRPLSPRGANRHPSLEQQFGTIPQSVAENSIASLVASYAARNFTMTLDNAFKVWQVQATQDAYARTASSFCVNLTLTVPEDTVMYVPELGEVLKASWVKYVTLAVLFLYVAEQLKRCIFANQVLPTRIMVDQAFERQKNPNRNLHNF